MNIEGLLHRLEAINVEHPGTTLRIDVSEKEGRIEEFRIEVYLFHSTGIHSNYSPPVHVYRLKRIGFDTWSRETIRGG